MGAKGSSSISLPAGQPIFRTEWGARRYDEMMRCLRYMPTAGQHEGLIDRIRYEENIVMGPAPESTADRDYQEAMKDVEAYEKLLEEGNT
jgi:polyphosphate kinase 2 (PPK2 family)